MTIISTVFKIAGVIIFAIAGIWGFLLCLKILFIEMGLLGGIIALMLAPVTAVAVPLYAGFVFNYWFPLALMYGGGASGLVLMVIGNALSSEEEKWGP